MILGQEQLALAGVGTEWVMGLLDTVRFADLDPYNHVNNKVYHTWFENLRVSYMAQSGFYFFHPERSQRQSVICISILIYCKTRRMRSTRITQMK